MVWIWFYFINFDLDFEILFKVSVYFFIKDIIYIYDIFYFKFKIVFCNKLLVSLKMIIEY